MTSHGSIPIDKNMDEILASIRQTIQEDLIEEDTGASLYSSNTHKSLAAKKPDHGFVKQNDTVLELTQMLSDDGTIVDLKDSGVKKVPQPTLRRPYSPLDRTPAVDLRPYQSTHVEDLSADQTDRVGDHVPTGIFEQQMGQQSYQKDTAFEKSCESKIESSHNSSSVQNNDQRDHKVHTGFVSGYHHEGHQARQPLPHMEQKHPSIVNDLTNVNTDPMPSLTPAYETTLTDVASYESTKPSPAVTPTNAYESIAARSTEQILSDKTIQDSLAALGSVNMPLPIKNDRNVINDSATPSAQQTIEDLVCELLRPLLKEWLDANLPTLVKWVVTEQVERVFKQQQKTP